MGGPLLCYAGHMFELIEENVEPVLATIKGAANGRSTLLTVPVLDPDGALRNYTFLIGPGIPVYTVQGVPAPRDVVRGRVRVCWLCLVLVWLVLCRLLAARVCRWRGTSCIRLPLPMR
jgi:hypothetical protein